MSHLSQAGSQEINTNKVKVLNGYSDYREWERSLLQQISLLGTEFEELLKGTYTEPKLPDPIEVPEGFLDEFPPKPDNIDNFIKKYWSFLAKVNQYKKNLKIHQLDHLYWKCVNEEVLDVIEPSLGHLFDQTMLFKRYDAYEVFCDIKRRCTEVLTDPINTFIQNELLSRIMAEPYLAVSP